MFHAIKPLSALTREEIAELGHLAAERGEAVEDVNPFTSGTHEATTFERSYRARSTELAHVA